jgi:ribosomal protein L7Ae-like RNA K-turn-binding protein
MSKIATMLGFAAKAGQLVRGTEAVTAAILKHRVHLVICAGDLAERTQKNFRGLCETNHVKYFCFATREELGHWIGSPGRGVIGVVSKQFASTIIALLEEEGTVKS